LAISEIDHQDSILDF